MKMKSVSLASAAVGFLLAACGQEAPLPDEPALEESVLQERAPQQPDSPNPAVPVPPSSEITIERIESLMVFRPSEQPGALVVLASGVVGSEGWSRPRLVPAKPDDITNTVSFNFVATSPGRERPESEPQAVEARFDMSMVRPEVEMVRIIGATNELTAFVDK